MLVSLFAYFAESAPHAALAKPLQARRKATSTHGSRSCCADERRALHTRSAIDAIGDAYHDDVDDKEQTRLVEATSRLSNQRCGREV